MDTAVTPARWKAPVAVAGAVAACCGYLAAVDPDGGAPLPACPLHALTGWWCPLCGSLRGVHHLLRGDPVAALSSNVALVVLLPVLVYAWVAWLSDAVGGPRLARPAAVPRWQVWVVVGVAALYGVARNLPWAPFPALAP